MNYINFLPTKKKPQKKELNYTVQFAVKFIVREEINQSYHHPFLWEHKMMWTSIFNKDA